MKIGIFGDSFGDDYHVWPNPYDGVGPSWIEYLQSCGHEVENFSCGATALFYSYDLFIKNYQKYDKVIFVVTHPSRYYVYVDQYQCNWYHIGQVKKSLDACEDPIKKIKLQAVYDFYANLQDDEYDYHVHRLLLKDIRKKHNSVLTIPCFRDSWVIGMPLIFISEFEAKFWKLPEVLPNRKNLYDARKCHMCEENNLMVGKAVEKWINTGVFEISPEDFCLPTREFEHYFRKDYKLFRD